MTGRKGTYRTLTVFAGLVLALVLACACGINRELVGRWKLVETDDSTFAAGMLFEFKEDRSLLVSLGTALLSEEESLAYLNSIGDTEITYSASPDGSLNLILTKRDSGRVTVRMTYELEEDLLKITDEDGIILVFHRQ